jgi:hypothetical protein
MKLITVPELPILQVLPNLCNKLTPSNANSYYITIYTSLKSNPLAPKSVHISNFTYFLSNSLNTINLSLALSPL